MKTNSREEWFRALETTHGVEKRKGLKKRFSDWKNAIFFCAFTFIFVGVIYCCAIAPERKKWEAEIDVESYQNIRDIRCVYPAIEPLIKKAMTDGKINYIERKRIFETYKRFLASESWKKERNREEKN